MVVLEHLKIPLNHRYRFPFRERATDEHLFATAFPSENGR